MGSDFRGCMKKILIIRIDFLGDMICTTALIKAIKKDGLILKFMC